MSLTQTGWEHIASLLIGDGVKTAYNNNSAYLGVGDGTDAFVNTQQDLTGTNKKRMPMDDSPVSYPTRTANVITFRATFGTGDANFTWNEDGIFNHATNVTDCMLTRAKETLITKTSAVSVVFTKTLTIQS